MTGWPKSPSSASIRLRGASPFALAIIAGLFSATAVDAAITNTVTATGSSPSGTGDVTATGNASVSVQTAAPGVSITKTATLPTGETKVKEGDTITYTYDVTNTGNTYLTNVAVTDAMTGNSGTLSAISLAVPPVTSHNTTTPSTDNGTDNVYDLLAPGDVAHFTATYVVTAQDILTNGAGTGNISDKATTAASYNNGTSSTPETATSSEVTVPLDTTSAMTVTKTASPTTGVKAGDVVTYTYVVKNTGNTNIKNISLVDTHNASGPVPVPGNETLDTPNSGNSTDAAKNGTWDLLAPGDSVTFTATYTVTQHDVDTLQ